MKQIILLVTLLSFVFLFGCTTKKQINELKEQNNLLQQQNDMLQQNINKSVTNINEASDELLGNSPDRVNIIMSWLGGSLSREVSIAGYLVYNSADGYPETTPINSTDIGYEYVGSYFNRGGYALVSSCNKGYKMTRCSSFGDNDSVDFEDKYGSCWLFNEDPDLLRVSMKIECTKE